MIPSHVDPSLHPDRPAPPVLDDGCSPPRAADAVPEPHRAQTPEPALPAKSEF